ncbi:MAG: phosphatase PAP2 family protein [Coriobacteriia bacterium]|nr:phosphatase PAP2 family protein [Coriobacteriia bacterium]
MDAQQYARWTAPLRARPALVRALTTTNKALTYLGYAAYPLLLVLVALSGDWVLFARVALGPGLGFALLTLVRKTVNKPRPYEALDIEPLIHKSTVGKSFPSRHAYSIFAIAGAWLLFCPPVGAALLVAGLFMAVVRVLGGVHYPVDVLAGTLCGLICGLI